jgi:hypothetical protein
MSGYNVAALIFSSLATVSADLIYERARTKQFDAELNEAYCSNIFERALILTFFNILIYSLIQSSSELYAKLNENQIMFSAACPIKIKLILDNNNNNPFSLQNCCGGCCQDDTHQGSISPKFYAQLLHQ